MARPNILWVVTTQWRGQATGLAGDSNARTPILDRLARSGVNFSQAVTPHPFGPFARAALLTGVPSPANGVRDYFDPLPVDARTVAHDLQDRGYATAFFGKWHLAPRDPTEALVGEAHAKIIVPENRRGGFSFWEGFESGFLLNDPWLHGTGLPAPTQLRGYQSDVLAARAAHWIKRSDVEKSDFVTSAQKSGNSPRPWFCLVSLEAPHPPYDAPVPEARDRGEPAKLVLPANVPLHGDVEAQARKELAGYYAHIAATDRALEKLFAEVGENTWIVVTSVHGDMHGAHGLFRKGWPHEESVRVPLVIANVTTEPRSRARGETSTAIISLLDLRALALNWADETPEKEWVSPRSLSDKNVQQISMPSVVALPHQCDRVWRGVRTAERKFVLNEDGSPWLFFDLTNDPLEQVNLVHDPRWTEELATWRQRVSDPG